MEISSTINPIACPLKSKKTVTENQQFERMWQNSISGEEFVRRTHEHIEKLYAIREKQQAGH